MQCKLQQLQEQAKRCNLNLMKLLRGVCFITTRLASNDCQHPWHSVSLGWQQCCTILLYHGVKNPNAVETRSTAISHHSMSSTRTISPCLELSELSSKAVRCKHQPMHSAKIAVRLLSQCELPIPTRLPNITLNQPTLPPLCACHRSCGLALP
jgi:hypothetical protein